MSPQTPRGSPCPAPGLSASCPPPAQCQPDPPAQCQLPPQPLVFGAMVHRDEAFETIFSQYLKITAGAASGSDS